jgi:hypothetical protein
MLPTEAEEEEISAEQPMAPSAPIETETDVINRLGLENVEPAFGSQEQGVSSPIIPPATTPDGIPVAVTTPKEEPKEEPIIKEDDEQESLADIPMTTPDGIPISGAKVEKKIALADVNAKYKDTGIQIDDLGKVSIGTEEKKAAQGLPDGSYRLAGKSANYQKIDGKWYKDANLTGDYQPIGGENVDSRAEYLESNAQATVSETQKKANEIINQRFGDMRKEVEGNRVAENNFTFNDFTKSQVADKTQQYNADGTVNFAYDPNAAKTKETFGVDTKDKTQLPDGVYKFPGSDASYQRINGDWKIDPKGGVNFVPMTKGNVAYRKAKLDTDAIYQSKPDGVYIFPGSKASYQRINGDWLIDPKGGSNYVQMTEGDVAARKMKLDLGAVKAVKASEFKDLGAIIKKQGIVGATVGIPSLTPSVEQSMMEKTAKKAEVLSNEFSKAKNFADANIMSQLTVKSADGSPIQVLTGDQMTSFIEYQNKVKDIIGDGSYTPAKAAKVEQVMKEAETYFNEAKQINAEINKARAEDKSLSRVSFEKKMQMADDLLTNSEEAIMFNTTANMADFVLDNVDNGKMRFDPEAGQYVISPSVSGAERQYLESKLAEYVDYYTSLQGEKYAESQASIQDDRQKLAATKRNIVKLESSLSEMKRNGVDEKSTEYQAVVQKLQESKNQADDYDVIIDKKTYATDAAFLTEPKKTAQTLALSLSEDAYNIIAAIPKDITPKQQFDLIYERLAAENDRLAKKYGLNTEGLGNANMKVKDMVDWDGFYALSKEEKQWLKNKATLNQMSPLYFNNSDMLSNEGTGFWESFTNSFYSTLFPTTAKAEGFANLSEASATSAQKLQEFGFKDEDYVTPEMAKQLEEQSKVDFWSAEKWGGMVGSTAAIIAPMMLTAGVPSTALRVVKGVEGLITGANVTKTAKIVANAEKIYNNALDATRFGRFLKPSIESAVKAEIAGDIFTSQEDELNFLSFMAGGVVSESLGAVFAKMPKDQVYKYLQGIFGNKVNVVINTIKKGGEATARGIGETGEETAQELVGIYQRTDNWQEMKAELDKQFGTFDQVQEFIVSSFILGAGFGLTESKSAKDAYDKLPTESREQVDAAINAIRQDLDEADGKVEEYAENKEKQQKVEEIIQENDKKDEEGVSGQVGEGQESVEGQPVAEAGQEAPSPSGVVQEEQGQAEQVTPAEEPVAEAPKPPKPQKVVANSIEEARELVKQGYVPANKSFSPTAIADLFNTRKKLPMVLAEQAPATTEAPAAEATTTETPTTEATTTEAPTTETPTSPEEATATETPSAAAATEATSTPTTEAPTTEATTKAPATETAKATSNTDEKRNNVDELNKIYQSDFFRDNRNTFYRNAEKELEAEAKKNKRMFGKPKAVTKEEIQKRAFENFAKSVQSNKDSESTGELNYAVFDGLGGWYMKDKSDAATPDVIDEDNHPDLRHEYGINRRKENWSEFDESYTKEGRRVVNIRVPVNTGNDTSRPSVFVSVTMEVPKGFTAEEIAQPIVDNMKTFNGQLSSQEASQKIVEQAKAIIKGSPKSTTGTTTENKAKPSQAAENTATETTAEPTVEGKTISQIAKEFADKVRKGKLGGEGLKSSIPGFDAAWNASLDTVAKAIELAGMSAQSIQDAIAKGFEVVAQSEWFKGLSKDQKKQAEADYKQGMNDKLNESNMTSAERQAAKEFASRVADATGTAKPQKTVQMTESEALRKQLKDKEAGGRTAGVWFRKIRKQIRDYAKENLPKGEYTKSEIDKITAALNAKDLEAALDKIDALIEKKAEATSKRDAKSAEAKRKATIKEIKDKVKSKRTILSRAGNKWKGKVTVEAQKEYAEYISTLNLDNLDGKTQEELDEINDIIDGIVSEGKADFKRLKQIEDDAKRERAAKLIEGLAKGQGVSLNSLSEVMQFLTDNVGSRVVVNGKLYDKTSFRELVRGMTEKGKTENRADEILEEITALTDAKNARVTELVKAGENVASDAEVKAISRKIDSKYKQLQKVQDKINSMPDVDVDVSGSTGYRQEVSQLAKSSEIIKSGRVGRRALRFFLPSINSVYNLLKKAWSGSSNVAKFIEERIAQPISLAYTNKTIELGKKREEYYSALDEIFGRYTAAEAAEFVGASSRSAKAVKKLSERVQGIIKTNVGKSAIITNGHLVDYYCLSQLDKGVERLKTSGVDVDKVKEIVEGDPQLKAYADWLMNKYKELGVEYEPTFVLATGMPFPVNKVYYPANASDFNQNFINEDDVMGDNNSFNTASAESRNMKQRVDYGGNFNISMDAHAKFLEYIASMEHAKQFVPISKSINELFSTINAPHLIKNLGIDNYNELKGHLARIISDRPINAIYEELFGKAISNVRAFSVISTLGAKVSSIAKQAVGFTHYYVLGMEHGLNPIKIMKGIPSNMREYELTKEIIGSEFFRERFSGQNFDVEIRRLMDEVSTSRGTKLSKSAAKLMMLAVRSGDAVAVLAGGIPYATAMYRQKLSEGMSDADARAFAFHEFVKATNETQQTTQADYTNQMQLDPAYRMMGMYRTGQMSAAKKVFEAAETIIQARKIQQEEGVEAREKIVPNKAIVQSVSNMIYFTVFAPVLFTIIAGNMMGSDDEEENERMWYDLKMDTLGSILQGYGFFGYLADGMLNYLRGDGWKVNVPTIRTLMALMEMPTDIARISQKTWTNMSSQERLYFLKKEGRQREVAEEDWMDMMNDFNERSFLGKMNEAETNRMIKNIGVKNIADFVNNMGEFFAGNKKLIDALMNYDEGYLDKAIESGKKDYIFEYFHGKPYIPEDKKPTETEMIYAPDSKIDIFSGEDERGLEGEFNY